MSDIKTVQMNVPEPTKNRRSRKQKEVVPSNTVKKAPVLPNLVKKEPVIVTNKPNDVPIKKTPILVTNKPEISVKQPVLVSMNKSLPYNESPLTPSPIKQVAKPVKIMPVKKPLVQTRKIETPSKVVIVKNRPNKTLKQKFVEKKIVIGIDSSKIRKTRDAVRRKVANMPLDDVCKVLRARGLIRETANPPPEIQRMMMIDILLFPTPM